MTAGDRAAAGASDALGRAGLASFAVLGASAAAALGVQLLLARVLGAARFGAYLYALTWMNVLAAVAVLGYDAAALRFAGAYGATGEWARLRGFLRRASAVGLAGAVVVGAVAAVAAAGFVAFRASAAAVVALVAVPLVPLLGGTKLLAAVLQGLGRVVLAQTLNGLVRPALFALLVALALAAGMPATAPAVMGLNVAATIGVVGIGALLLRRMVPGGPGAAPADPGWDRSARGQLVIVVSQLGLLYTDTLVVGALLGTLEAGVYAVAAQLASLAGFAIPALNGVAAPRMAGLHARADHRGLARLAGRVARAATAYALVAALALAAAATWVLAAFGEAFGAGLPALLVLAGAQLVAAAFAPAGFLLTMTGREAAAGRVVATAAAAHLVLVTVLVPVAGLAGAAAATLLSVAGRNVALGQLVRRELGLSIPAMLRSRGG
jgi:O-antigen/teichoic acid export membrane protein